VNFPEDLRTATPVQWLAGLPQILGKAPILNYGSNGAARPSCSLRGTLKL